MVYQGITKGDEDIHQKTYDQILFTSRWLENHESESFKHLGITQQQYNVLQILRDKHPESCSATYVKKTMAEKNPDLTRLVDRLLKKGMVTRNACSNNRRKVDISITSKGLSMLNVVEPLVTEPIKVLKKITPEEAEELCRILDKLRD